MAKKKSESESSVELPAMIETGPSGIQSLPDVTTMSEILREGGASATFVGGSLPLLQFTRQGQCVLGIYEGREEREDLEFAILTFSVLDPERYVQDRANPRKATTMRGQLIESTALRDWTMNLTENRGKVVLVTYGGEVATKRGMNKLKLFSIAEVK